MASGSGRTRWCSTSRCRTRTWRRSTRWTRRAAPIGHARAGGGERPSAGANRDAGVGVDQTVLVVDELALEVECGRAVVVAVPLAVGVVVQAHVALFEPLDPQIGNPDIGGGDVCA